MNFNTSRLILKPIQLGDADQVLAYRSDAETNQYQGWIPKTLQDVEKFILKISPEIDQPGTWFQFVIILKETGNIVGDLGIHFLESESQQVKIGYTLSREYQGQGYATEAVRCILDYLFHDLKKHRVTVTIDPCNVPSIKLVERLGFRKETHFVESLFVNGKWVDDVVYAILDKEWDKK